MSKKYVKTIENCTECGNCEFWSKESYYRTSLYVCVKMERIIAVLGVSDSISKMVIPEWCPLEDRL